MPKHATLIDHQSLIDCQTGDQNEKTKLIYSCFFRGDKLDPEIATQWLIINANPTYITSPPLPLYPLLSSVPSLCLFYSLWLWSLLQFAFDPRIAGCNCWLCCFCFLAGFGLAFFELLSLHAVVPPIDVGFINFVCHYYSSWLLVEKREGGGVALTPRLLSRYLHLRQAQSLNEACKQRENFT